MWLFYFDIFSFHLNTFITKVFMIEFHFSLTMCITLQPWPPSVSPPSHSPPCLSGAGILHLSLSLFLNFSPFRHCVLHYCNERDTMHTTLSCSTPSYCPERETFNVFFVDCCCVSFRILFVFRLKHICGTWKLENKDKCFLT